MKTIDQWLWDARVGAKSNGPYNDPELHERILALIDLVEKKDAAAADLIREIEIMKNQKQELYLDSPNIWALENAVALTEQLK